MPGSCLINPKYPVRPRVRPATEAGLMRSTEAAKA
jgi:hypothetical protein